MVDPHRAGNRVGIVDDHEGNAPRSPGARRRSVPIDGLCELARLQRVPSGGGVDADIRGDLEQRIDRADVSTLGEIGGVETVAQDGARADRLGVVQQLDLIAQRGFAIFVILAASVLVTLVVTVGTFLVTSRMMRRGRSAS